MITLFMLFLIVANNSSAILKLIILDEVRSQLKRVISVSNIRSTCKHIDLEVSSKIASKKLHQVL